MKKIFTFLFAAAFAATCWAQTPEKVLKSDQPQRVNVLSRQHVDANLPAKAIEKKGERLLRNVLPAQREAWSLLPDGKFQNSERPNLSAYTLAVPGKRAVQSNVSERGERILNVASSTRIAAGKHAPAYSKSAKSGERISADALRMHSTQQAAFKAPNAVNDVIVVTPASPYYKDFEDYDLTDWSYVLGSTFPFLAWMDATGWADLGVEPIQDGNQTLYVSWGDVGDIAYVVTPVFDITALSTPTLSFLTMLIELQGVAEELRVYYRAAATDAWTLLPGMEFTLSNTTADVWRNPSVALPSPSATYQLKFEVTGQDAYGIGIDAVRIEEGGDSDCEAVVVTPAAPFHEGFEGDVTLPCWDLSAGSSFVLFPLLNEDLVADFGINPTSDGEQMLFVSWGDVGDIAYIVTPVLDITALSTPTLSFEAILLDYLGGTEELRVYYRAAETDSWTLLPETELTSGNSAHDTWLSTSVALPSPSATYQLKFEVTGKDAQGIVLDAVNVGDEVTNDCTPIVVTPTEPYLEGAEGPIDALPLCWNAVVAPSSYGIYIFDNDGWSNFSSSPIREGNQTFWVSYSDVGEITYMESPVLDITALSTPTLSFYAHLLSFLGAVEELRVYYRAAATDAWTLLPGMEFTGANTAVGVWHNPSVSLPSPSATYQLKFEITGQDGYGVGLDGLYVGDYVDPCPTVVVTTANPYHEGFESASYIPDCWSYQLAGSFPGIAVFDDAGLDGTGAALIEEGAQTLWVSWGTTVGDIAYIETPVFDITGLSEPGLSFKHQLLDYQGASEQLRVYYRAAATDDWTLLPGMEFTDNATSGSWLNNSVALPSPSATYQVKFEVTAQDAYGLLIDDVNIGELITCIAPSTVVVSNATYESADISWTSNASAWNIIVSDVEITDFTSVTPTAAGLTSASYSAIGLDAATTYYVYVQSDCGVNDKSAWTATTFNTDACTPDDKCTFTVITHDSWGDGWHGGTLSFVQNGVVVASVTNDASTGTSPQTFLVELCDGAATELVWSKGAYLDEVSFEFMDATGSVLYGVARNTLGNGNVLALSNPLYTFTVDCAAAVCETIEVTTANPYHEGFENSLYMPRCWSSQLAGSFPSIAITDDAGMAGIGAALIEEGVQALWISWGTTVGDIAYIVTPVFDITGLSAPGLSFKHQLLDYQGASEQLRVYYRAAETDAWTLLPGMEFTDNATSGSWFNNSVALPSPSATYQLKFEITAQDGQGLLIDDVNIGELITCVVPSAVTSSNVTHESADISWTSDASAWNIIVSDVEITDFSSVTPTATGLTSASYTATGLDANTTYYVYVQSDCGATDKSAWASATFKTAICASEDKCTYTVVTTDDYGDGWDGAGTLRFVQEGVVVATVRNINNNYSKDPQTFQVELCKDIATELVWYQGAYLQEVAFELFDASGVSLFAVATGELGNSNVLALTNPLYTFTVECAAIVELEVVSSSVEDGAVEVDPETTGINITLNDDVDVNGTPDFSGVTLVAPNGNVDVVVTYADGVITVTLADGVKLEGETEYTLTIPDGAVPGLDGATVITFTTGPVTGVGNIETDGIRIYPSITDGKVTIEAPNGSKVKITDLTGRIVDSYDSVQFGQTIDISRVAGTYFVIVENGNMRKVQKIILK
ncbi:MAG: Ig-like domain-containing protein [Prevotellaceae bacterium]|jgi:hypothetical protein|nr:Ig-like domain-containing protein [Prevotellaceae bacterium]